MSMAYDVIFSVIAGLPKVYPNFLDVPHIVLQQYEEKLRAPLMHKGTPSAYSLLCFRVSPAVSKQYKLNIQHFGLIFRAIYSPDRTN